MSQVLVATKMPKGLRYTSDNAPGYTRSAPGDKTIILDDSGDACSEAEVLQRVASMVIPPQWSDVWIAKSPTAHIQCTGRDARGRKQYIYHEAYVTYRQQAKFDKMIDFAEALPGLRAEVSKQLRRRTWDKERMLALTVRLLDKAHLRIGSARYEAENDTYGLTTLRRRHVQSEEDAELRLCFSGKSGKFRRVTIKNRRLQKLVREVADLPGYRLFHYFDENGNPADLDSGDVNDYLHRHMGERFSAKDFRTWGGTSYAVRLYPEAKRLHDLKGRGKLESRLVKMVAAELGNTVSVCRQYYIHPLVLEAAKARTLPDAPWDEHDNGVALAPYELATIELIDQARA